jgi:hypothetical protein
MNTWALEMGFWTVVLALDICGLIFALCSYYMDKKMKRSIK